MNQTTFYTHEIAELIGVHPNTVRLYEKIGFISPPHRQTNGYRVFTLLHVRQMQLARAALRGEVLQNGLRKKAVEIIHLCAECKFSEAVEMTKEYDAMLAKEMDLAQAAIDFVEHHLQTDTTAEPVLMRRSQAAQALEITVDTLRNWELNGLIKVKRSNNGYRVYDQADLERLRVIRALRSANYSLSAILRLLNQFTEDAGVKVEDILNTPAQNESIVSVCDRLLLSLEQTRQDAAQMLNLLEQLITNS